jgi:hypothetical protein
MVRPNPFPWLDHLQKDHRGLPVPYVNAWGPQVPDVRPDDHVEGRLALFNVDDFNGAPDFTRQSAQRQRQCMVEGLCQVCGLGVPWQARYLVVSSVSVAFVALPGRPPVPLVSEPWLCGRCAKIATRWCPALLRRRDTSDLMVHRIESPADVTVRMSTGRVDGFPDAGDQVVIWVKLSLTTLRIVPGPGAEVVTP